MLRYRVGQTVAALALASASAAFAADPATQASFVQEAAQRFDIPAAWIWAVMRAESAFEPHALSPAGAIGLMQVMPKTYGELRVRHGLGPDPFDPRDNILAGAAYLRELHDRYGAPGFLAAYNAGPARYEAHLAGRALPAETRAYVAALAPLIGGAPALSTPPQASPPSVFVVIDPVGRGLFVRRVSADEARP